MGDVVRCACGKEWEATAVPPVCGACGAELAACAATLPPESAALTLAPEGASEAGAPAVVPGYEVRRELGRGGMGVVYEARQISLDRIVALKMILAGAHAGAAELSRFRTEAQAIARLRHPNIIQIHEVGAHDGRPYFSLEFCAGGSLEKMLRGTPLPPASAAALIETLARAMHHAHGHGVIHRDLKPANVLLAEDGSPRITDFGLAKALGDDSGLTASNAIMGTPSYMAPEQAAGKTRDLGPACDIYSLGAILYECLTGRPPFRAATPIDTLRQVIDEEPVPPSRLNPAVPRDLETVCLKCLGKLPAKRYAAAGELADDLARWQRGEPIRARPLGAMERSIRWVRRHRLASAIIVQTALLFLVLIGGFAYYQLHETKRARESLKQVQAEREQAQDSLARGHYEQARALLRSREPGRRQAALDLLAKAEALRGRERHSDIETALPLPSRAELRREAAAALLTEDARELDPINVSLSIGTFSEVGPDATWLMATFIRQIPQKIGDVPSAGLRLFDLRDGKVRGELQRADFFAAKALAVSPDATIIAHWEQLRPAVQLIEFPSGKTLRTLTRPALPEGTKPLSAGTHFLRFSPDGRRLIGGEASAKEADLFVWDLQGPLNSRHVARVSAFVDDVAVRTDGGAIAAPRGGSKVAVWDLAKAGPPLEIDAKFDVVEDQKAGNLRGFHKTALVFSHDGSRLAVAAKTPDKLNVAVFALPGGSELLRKELPFPGEAPALDFAPDGRRLAVGDALGSVHCFDLDYGQEAWALDGLFPTGVHLLKWAPTGRLLTGGMIANRLRVWEPSTDRFESSVGPTGMAVADVEFGPGAKWLAMHAGGHEKTLRVLPLTGDEKEWALPLPAEPGQRRSLQLQAARNELAVFCRGTTVVVSLATRREARRVAAPVGAGLMMRLDDARFLPDGRIIAPVTESTKTGRHVVTRDRESGTALGPGIEFPKATGLLLLGDTRLDRLSDDGRLLAVCRLPFMPSRDPVTIWKVESGEKLAELPADDESSLPAFTQFSPDGRWFLRMAMPFSYDTGTAKSSDMRFMLAESATGRKRWEFTCPLPPNVAEFSPDGRLLAVGYEYGGIDLYDAQTGAQLFRWQPPGLREAHRLAFAPDASLLAVVGNTGPIRLLHLADLRKHLAELGLDW